MGQESDPADRPVSTGDTPIVPVSRRQLLAAAGSGSVFGLAGCSGQTGGDGTETTVTTTTSGEGGEQTEATETTTQATQKGGGKLTIAQVKSPPDFDPVRQLGGPAAIIGTQVFSNLYNYGSDLELMVGDLATGMPEIEKDGTRYIVSIVDDARFHNGNPVTADDVAYSFQAVIDEETRNYNTIKMIDSIEVVDDTTVQFDLKYQYAAFKSALASIFIVPKAVREKDRKAFALENPVGSGPFEFADWKQNEFVRLKAWDYWGDPQPYLDEVEFIPIVEPTTRVTNFRQGNSGMMQGVPPNLWSTVKNLENSSIKQTTGLNYYYITFNLNEGQTTKQKVRDAVSYCFDMDEVVKRFIQPAGQRQYQPLPIPTAKAWDMPIEEFKSMAHGKDIDKAKSLFDDANVPDDWTCTLLSPPDDKRENMLITVANGIKEAGYDAEVQRLQWGAYLNKFATGQKEDYQAYALGWSLSPDPDGQMYPMYHISGKGSNQGHYWRDEQAMNLIEESRRTTDRERRREIYIKLQKMIIRQKVQIPAYNLKVAWATKDYVKDFPVNPQPTANPMLTTNENNVWLDE